MVEGLVLLPGWNTRDYFDQSRALRCSWPAVRPPQVGESIEIPTGGGPHYRDVRTVTAVAWQVLPTAQHDRRGLWQHVVGLAVEVGERSPFPC